MTASNRSFHRIPVLTGAIVLLLQGATGLTAQEAQTFHACLVPEVGALYMTQAPGLPAKCLSPSHVAISWTDGGDGPAVGETISGVPTVSTPEREQPQYLVANGVSPSTDGFAVTGEAGTGSIPQEGPGARLMWYPGKYAFRAGLAEGEEWDGDLVGTGSLGVGRHVEASGSWSTALGHSTKASGEFATSLGSTTIASGWASTAMGMRTTASGSSSTAMGFETTASGRYSTATGFETTASGRLSSAMGDRSQALHDDTFVWSGGRHPQSAAFASTDEGQFLIDASGGVGIGTNSPRTELDVRRNVGGTAGISNHVAYFHNTATSSGDVLMLQSDAPYVDTSVNFITFRGPDANIGSIEGNGYGGVTLNTSSGDFAERLPRLQKDETIEPGEVVGLFGGAVSKSTDGADQLMVVTDRAVVLGNDPGPEARADYEKVAFLGQVPVRVRGPVKRGDLLVASGRDDGAARAVAPADYRPAVDGPVVGQAWEASTGGARRVNALVGADGRAAALQSVVERQQVRLELQDTRIDEQAERLERLEREMERLEGFPE